jgi:hypothetical protein
MERVFLLSPARCDGRRAEILLNPTADFDLAVRLRSGAGVTLGEAFAFLSGLYFRGKLAYAAAFGARASGPSSYVITTDRGLVTPDTVIHRDDLCAFAEVDIAKGDARYVAPLDRDAARLAGALANDARIVLLGSVATGKYVDILGAAFGERLVFPTAFVGRGDMSRGGLLLRAERAKQELEYAPVLGAVRHGKRPPKLERSR